MRVTHIPPSSPVVILQSLGLKPVEVVDVPRRVLGPVDTNADRVVGDCGRVDADEELIIRGMVVRVPIFPRPISCL